MTYFALKAIINLS